jgi:hypothetical protein
MEKKTAKRDHRPIAFRKGDVTRAFLAAQDAGIPHPTVEIILPNKSVMKVGGAMASKSEAAATPKATNLPSQATNLDAELEEFKARHRGQD